jgi:hypothetical protein
MKFITTMSPSPGCASPVLSVKTTQAKPESLRCASSGAAPTLAGAEVSTSTLVARSERTTTAGLSAVPATDESLSAGAGVLPLQAVSEAASTTQQTRNGLDFTGVF